MTIFETRPTFNELEKEYVGSLKKDFFIGMFCLVIVSMIIGLLRDYFKNVQLLLETIVVVDILIAIYLMIVLLYYFNRKKEVSERFANKCNSSFLSTLSVKWYKNNLESILKNSDKEEFEIVETKKTETIMDRYYLEDRNLANLEEKKKTILFEYLLENVTDKMYKICFLYKNKEGSYFEKTLFVYFKIEENNLNKLYITKTSIEENDMGKTIEFGKVTCTEEFYKKNIFNRN